MRFIRFVLLVCLILGAALPAASSASSPVEDLMARMSLEQEVGQLFVIRFWGKDANTSVALLIKTIHPAGAVLLPHNIDTPKQVTRLTNGLQALAVTGESGVPLLIMTDQEGGTVQRLRDGFTRMPDPLLLGAITDRSVVVNYGRMVGSELAAVGLNMDLAPVVDLATRPDNPVLADRMISDDPQRVTEVASAMVEGMNAAGVIGALKHFPGHGDAADTHVNIAWLPYNLARLNAMELVPFFHVNAPVIMLGHISAPALDPSGTPASLSGPMIQYLRDRGGYNGVLITDAMDMGAIINHYRYSQGIVQAVKAGADLILLGAYVSTPQQIVAYRAVLAAVRSGEIPRAQLDAAVRRVLQLKQAYGLLSWSRLDPDQVDARLNLASGDEILAAAYQSALTLVKNKGNVIPLPAGQRTGIIYPSIHPDIAQACTAAATGPVETMPVSFTPLRFEISQARALAKRVDRIVVFTEDADKNTSQQDLVHALPAERTIVVALRSPYDLRMMPSSITAYLEAYSPAAPAYQTACAVVFGRQGSQGVLPVMLSSTYPSGWGIILAGPGTAVF